MGLLLIGVVLWWDLTIIVVVDLLPLEMLVSLLLGITGGVTLIIVIVLIVVVVFIAVSVGVEFLFFIVLRRTLFLLLPYRRYLTVDDVVEIISRLWLDSRHNRQL